MKLSICMMIKNEARWLKKSLQSIQALRDEVESELIIVDTGSTDNSVEIARSFTEKVYFHKWTDDFSEMRNITISYAQGDWILILDGDEIFEDVKGMIRFLSTTKSDEFSIASFHIKNFLDENNWGHFYIFIAARLFKRVPDFAYEGAVHNLPVVKGESFLLPDVIYHYGYLATDKELMERKFERTGRILKRELKKNPENIYYWYQLSSTYGMHGDIQESLEPIERAYDLCRIKKVDWNDHLYVFGQLALTYHRLERYEDVERICLQANKVWNGSVDIYFFLAQAQIKLKKDEAALENYLIYLDMVANYDSLKKNSLISDYTLVFADDVRFDVCTLLMLKRENVEERVLLLAEEITAPACIKKIIPGIIDLNCRLQSYERLYGYYERIIVSKHLHLKDCFQMALQEEVAELSAENGIKIAECFINSKDVYSVYWSWKIQCLRKNIKTLSPKMQQELQAAEWSNLPLAFSEILYEQIKAEKEIQLKISEKAAWEYLKKLEVEKCDLLPRILMFLKMAKIGKKLSKVMWQRILAQYALLQFSEGTSEEYVFVLQRYFSAGIMEIKAIYQADILESGVLADIPHSEHAFLANAYLAKKSKKGNVSEGYIEQALEIQPQMQLHLKAWLQKT